MKSTKSTLRENYRPDWESLSSHPVPEWYKKSRFGIFIHWGAYSVPAYLNEWYPRMMYYKGNPVYRHHVRKYGRQFPYRKFIDSFTAPEFDADKWLETIAAAGAQFVMPVAEHHDGYKLYDSDLSRWTTVKRFGRIKSLRRKTRHRIYNVIAPCRTFLVYERSADFGLPYRSKR